MAVKPQHSKQIRMFVQSQKFESGTAVLPKQAPWLADYEAELFAFPHTLHDDQVDSTSQPLAYEPALPCSSLHKPAGDRPDSYA
jgi:predicted phage terminase large subunit-like protein